jgi:hypothetical protein
MRTDIAAMRAGIGQGKEMAEALFGQNTPEFGTFMCGVFAQAFDDLCEHVAELEQWVDERERKDATTTTD